MTDHPTRTAELADALTGLSACLLMTVEAADDVVFLLTGKRPGEEDTDALRTDALARFGADSDALQADTTADTFAATNTDSRADSTAATKRPVLSLVRDNAGPEVS